MSWYTQAQTQQTYGTSVSQLMTIHLRLSPSHPLPLSLSLRRSFSLRLCFCCFVRACNHAMAVFSVQCLHFLAFSYQIKWNNTADSIWSECILIDKNRAKLNGNDSMTTTTTTTMTNANDDNVLNGISQG